MREERPISSGVGRLVAFVLLLAVIAPSWSAAAPVVNVSRAPLSIEYRSYVAGHPPPGVIASSETAVGICDAQFRTLAQSHALYPRWGVRSVTATVQSVEISLTLKIVIWLSEGSGSDVLKHEETHRAIAEHFYAMGEAIGRRSGERMIGRRILLPARNNAELLETELGRVTQEIVDDVQRQLGDRCSFAQKKFDEITDHGRNRITVADAKSRALAEETAHWASIQYSSTNRSGKVATLPARTGLTN